jgi:hypothetical protein
MARRVIVHTITRLVITGLALMLAEDIMARRVTILDPMRVAIIRLAPLSLTDITVRRAITLNITPVIITPGLS